MEYINFACGRIGKVLHYSSRFATYLTLLRSITQHQAHTPYSVAMACIHDTDLLCWITGRVPDYAVSNLIEAGDLELRSPPNFLDTLYRWETGDMAAHTHFNYGSIRRSIRWKSWGTEVICRATL